MDSKKFVGLCLTVFDVPRRWCSWLPIEWCGEQKYLRGPANASVIAGLISRLRVLLIVSSILSGAEESGPTPLNDLGFLWLASRGRQHIFRFPECGGLGGLDAGFPVAGMLSGWRRSVFQTRFVTSSKHRPSFCKCRAANALRVMDSVIMIKAYLYNDMRSLSSPTASVIE